METAKKIQAGEIEGRIKSIDGCEIKTIIRINGAKTYNDEQLSLVEYINGKKDFTFFKGLFIELPEEIQNYEFKPFDKVLVRYPDKTELYISRYKWIPGIFQYKSINSNLYFVSGRAYRDCIPYEGNENLVGTIDKPKEE